MNASSPFRVPAIKGIIARRILINYRIDPVVLQKLLPAPFSPQIHDGMAIAGVCLIRLEKIRPACLPLPFGLSSENSAFRFAVIWKENGIRHEGVYIPKRLSSSLLNRVAGGRVFAGVHERATFKVSETDSSYSINIAAKDTDGNIKYRGDVCQEIPSGSIFSNLEDVSIFFENGSCGYSPTKSSDVLEGLELRVPDWKMQALATQVVECNYFDNTDRFPSGSTEFDNALLMLNIEHEWHSLGAIKCV